jgi:hypothetical protein
MKFNSIVFQPMHYTAGFQNSIEFPHIAILYIIIQIIYIAQNRSNWLMKQLLETIEGLRKNESYMGIYILSFLLTGITTFLFYRFNPLNIIEQKSLLIVSGSCFLPMFAFWTACMSYVEVRLKKRKHVDAKSLLKQDLMSLSKEKKSILLELHKKESEGFLFKYDADINDLYFDGFLIEGTKNSANKDEKYLKINPKYKEFANLLYD